MPANQPPLRNALLNSPRVHEIKEAFYKATEGLEALASELAHADVESASQGGPLFECYKKVVEADIAISNLGLVEYL